jgi:tetratricopeptide (TPR) repeat protein
LRIIGRRRIVAAVAVAILCSGTWLYFPTRDSLSELIRKAYITGNYDEVLSLSGRLNAATEVEPETWWYIVLASQSLGKTDKAIDYFRIAVESSGESPIAIDATIQLAKMLKEHGRHAEAVDTVTALTGRSLGLAELHNFAASRLDLLGRRYEANEHHLTVVKSGRHSVDDLILLANRHEPFAGPKVEQAMRDPMSTEFRMTRGMIAWRSGKLDEAVDLVRAELAEHPESLEAHALLGRALLELG